MKMNSTTKKHYAKGMTLVEVVVTCLLLSILAGVLYSSLTGIIRASKAIESQRETLRTVRSVFGRMIKELNGAVPDALYVNEESTTGSTGRGKKLYFLGLNATSGSTNNDSIRFVTTSGAQAVAAGR